MKKILFLAFLSYATVAFSETGEFRGQAANDLVEGAELVWIKQNNTIPSFVQFRPGNEMPESEFLLYLKKKFLLPTGYFFQQTKNETDLLGWQHNRYQVYVNGVPVGNANFVLHLRNGRVEKFNGYVFKNISTGPIASLDEASALGKALKDIGATTYKWQLAGEEEFLKQESENPSATFFPKGTLEIVQVGDINSTSFKLAWKFDVYAHEPMGRFYVYVDAQTGEVLKKVSRICDVNTNGTAVTAYRGARGIVADSNAGTYRLRETTRGLGVRTFNMQKGTNYAAAVDFTDADNYWNNVNTNKDQYAGDAHWGAEMTYDFYLANGRNSIDNAGFQLNLYVHYDVGYLNAFWDGTRMTFGDGSTGYNPLTSLDITGHEISHGLDENTANLTYSYESGALNESFSDIFGTAVEWYADSTTGNWLIGEDIGGAFRSMSNPNAYNDPDTYLGTNWYTGTADNGGVHTNSNVQNHWYYRLAQGGTGTNDIGSVYNVTGIGRHKATQIAWRNMIYYLTSSSDYADARFYAIQSANDLFGTCSPEAISTTNAWYAVGVGAAFSFGVDAQFTASPTVGCTAPLTVNFINTSTNANNFTWNFGDGGTSTATNPSHIYNTIGTYTVKLVANGGSCGVDSLISANLINISATNPCVVIMPSSGTYQTQTGCNGTIYDNGGSAANYTDNTNSTVTISPTGASQVKLHFTQFSMENTYDFLYVYDGPNTTSPVLGSFTGATIPADITSTGSSITIRQTSDQNVNAAGYTIQWTCISPTSPPVANFKADVTSSCTGTINFTDLSTGGPTSWLWNFGDGGTATVKNPAHSYAANGTYTVSLTATNAYGNNTMTKTNYVTVSKPSGPVTSSLSSCGPSSFSLSANTTNAVNWYDSSGTVVSTSNPFTTPVLNTTTTYYAESTVPQPIYKVGAVSNAIGSGSYYNGTQTRALRFRVYKNCKLVSVYVYAQGAGYRTVQYRDSLGGLITEKTVYVPNGGSRINLNIDLIPGGAYELGLRDTMYLYRNSSNAAYPYNDANGMVSIFGNNAGAGSETYYYFFYDWEVKEQDCISLRTPATLTVNPAVTVSATSTNVSCNAGNNGNASVSVLTGTPNYTYNWSSGQTTASLTNIAAGTYTVTVTDSKGCTATATKTITQPTAISPSYTVTNVSCNGGNNGALAANVSGGTSPYTYNWGSGITTPGRTNLAAGNYTVTITDANNCSSSVTKTVTQPAVLSTSSSKTNPSCSYNSNGSITLASTGGTGTYTYNWSGGLGSGAAKTNLAAGTYSVTTTDQNNCTTITTHTLTAPSAITVATTSASAICTAANGSITALASGGTGTLSYHWSTGVNSAALNNVLPGTYGLTVTDANSCTTTTSATVTLTNNTLLGSTAGTNPLCNGSSNGGASVSVSGGTQPYSYTWSNGATAASISNIAAGMYNVTASDVNGCSVSASVTITQPTALILQLTPVSATCTAANGSVGLQVNGGSPSYTYNWSNSSTGPALSNQAAGTYTVTVTDANSCTATANATIASTGSISATATGSNALCDSGNSGSATVQPVSGTAPYTYNWSNSGSTASLNNLAAGTYSVSVTDANGCSTTTSVTITEPPAIAAIASTTNSICSAANGEITLQTSGGTGAYSYNWSNGATSQNISNLTGGSYTVTITDANNCTTTNSATVNSSGSLTFSASTNNALCNGGNSGSASVIINAGTSPYNYNWSNGATSGTANNLAAGNYTVSVTDVNGCSATAAITITEPAALSASATGTDAGCSGNDGSLAAYVSGGTSAYTYLWNNAATTSAITNLTAGQYTLTVTDANNCSATAVGTVGTNGGVSVASSFTDVLCNGGNTGSAHISIVSGTAPYIFVWSNGNTDSVAANLVPGTYTVSVTDGNNCVTSASFTINEPSSLTVATGAIYPLCNGDNNGSAMLNVTGGTAGYTYVWSNGASSAINNNLAAGTYYVTITDANNCTTTANVTLTQPDALNISFMGTNVACFGDNTGFVSTSINGGTPSYNYNWSNGTTAAQLSNVAAGNYQLTVTDSHNCTSTITIGVTEPSEITYTTATTDATSGSNNGTASVNNLSGGVAPYSVQWSNGLSGNTATNLAAGTYSVTITDANGCEKVSSVTVNESVGVNELNSGLSFTLLPNPASEEVTLSINLSTEAVINVSNVLGQSLLQTKALATQTSIKIQISDLAAGVYYVELISNGKKSVKQLVIQH